MVVLVESPAAWLTGNRDLWPQTGRVLDLACGKGRHALLMADSGLQVRAIDRSPDAIAALAAEADRLELPIETAVVDLETDPPPGLGESLYDMIVVFNYLHRPLMPMIRTAVKPGGRIVYETFTTRQAERGKPRNPAFLLREGELRELMAPFRVLRSREGDIDGRFIASIIAER
ncbi:MAG TPA: methyltransferase domain-containing protein [Vicinamibacterales bacterium]|nr:methyltransferase domain-containing protein [Vicinamibacterales bacterium]